MVIISSNKQFHNLHTLQTVKLKVKLLELLKLKVKLLDIDTNPTNVTQGLYT